MKKRESIPVTLDTLRRMNWKYRYDPTLIRPGEDYFEQYRFDFNFETKTIHLWGLITNRLGLTSTHFIHSYDDWEIYNEL